MKRQEFLFAVSLIFCILISCNGDKDIPIGQSEGPLKLIDFSPKEGGIREKVVLTGENFGNDPSKIKVYFNQSRAAVISTNGNKIYALVPRLPGDTCIVSVVKDNDSLIFSETFKYYSTSNVSTITGNGVTTFKEGNLAQAQVYSRYITVDEENNIFASVRDGGTYAVVRINERENIVTPLIMSSSSSPLNPNGGTIHPETGVLYVPHDGNKFIYYTFDPRELYAPRERTMKFDPAEVNQFTGLYKYGIAYCTYDRHMYTRLNSGEIVKINPETFESTVIFRPVSNAGYGLAFHPLKPYLLYLSFHSGTGLANAIYSLDIRDPNNPESFKRLSSPLTSTGHRDGPFETAQFNSPRQLSFDKDGNLFIADYGNHCIRMVTPNNMVQTVVGIPGTAGMQDGDKSGALFRNPWGIAVGNDGTVYISDYGNARIRKLVIE